MVFLGIGSIIGVYFIPYPIKIILNMCFFFVVLLSLFSRKGGFIRNKFSMYTYSLVLGILSGSAYIYYFQNLGGELFFSIVLGVVLIFCLAYYIAAKSSDEKIFRLSPIVFGGLIVLLIVELLNIFLFRFDTYVLIISALGIIIYSVYAVIIMKLLQNRYKYGVLNEQEIVSFAYSILISFLNLLLDLLRLVSIIKDDN